MKWLSVLALSVFSLFATAQNVSLDISKSTMTVEGTSTIHDWESNVEKFTSNGTLSQTEGTSIESIALNVQVESIKSGKSGMDKKTYEALKSKKNPTISFQSTRAAVLSGDKVIIIGKLSVAGATKEISIPVTAKIAGNTLMISGSYSIHMPDYGMERPTAMMGTIKAGENIKVVFNLVYLIK